MNDAIETLQAEQQLDIFAKRVLAKAILPGTQEVFQEKYDDTNNPTGEKLPLKLFIINYGSTPTEQPVQGSPVKCVKLCKRVIALDYPQNTIICTQKSRVTVRFQLVLIVEYENGAFDVITLPKNLSSRLHSAATTKAYVESTVIDANGIPVLQRQNKVVPYESLIIKYNGVNDYTAFDYTVTIPLSLFDNILRHCELEDPSLQSYILLRNLKYDVDILDVFQLFTNAGNTTSVWTTIVNFSLLEDIIDKLGIDQDISILGTPEFEC